MATQPDADATLIRIYQTVAARRSGYDALMWQMPMLSLTAQAFLFTIALGSGDRFARLTSSLLTIAVTLASWHTMRRFRRGELLDSKLLERIEMSLRAPELIQKLPAAGDKNPAVGYCPHTKFEERPDATAGRWGRLLRLRPAIAWYGALWAFGLAAVSAFIHALS